MTTENLTGKTPMLMSAERLAAYENLRAAANDVIANNAYPSLLAEALAALDRLDQEGKP